MDIAGGVIILSTTVRLERTIQEGQSKMSVENDNTFVHRRIEAKEGRRKHSDRIATSYR